MHRLIVGLSNDDKRVVDHIDGNPLNNQRSNLRVCAPSQNIKNQRLRTDSTSGLKGVSKYQGYWRARIQVDGKRINLGNFSTREEAHAAYCLAARQFHREFANFGTAETVIKGAKMRFGKANSTGFNGVSKRGQNRWRARFRGNDKAVYLGEFSSPRAAYAAYCKASALSRNDFDARTGAVLMRALDFIIDIEQRKGQA
jgi:hypothetical protein